MAPGTTQAPKSTSTTFKANKPPGSCCFKWHALTALPGMFIMGELHSQGDPNLAPQSVQTCFFFFFLLPAWLPEPSNAIILSGQLTSPDQRTKTLLALTTFPTIQRSLWILQTRTRFWLILLSVDGAGWVVYTVLCLTIGNSCNPGRKFKEWSDRKRIQSEP